MTENKQDFSQQLLNDPIYDDKFWELKPEKKNETQNEIWNQQEQIVPNPDQPQINQENPKEQQGFWALCICQCIGECLASFCLEIAIRGLC
ncbi:unnamed protein product [Paramecium sonneborni]|uniref:Uncharacterized protein n=1 Tax=Paramecium sonneborni TaxID=65129 RepID=A0A8S1RE31_9CILI|nr:unnamed protein product [Paramecium sonneborni]